MERTASCSCGRLRIRTVGEPAKVSACHCLACRLRTGSAFGVAVFYNSDATEPSGASTIYRRQGESGHSLDFHFCPTCGSTVFWYPAFRPGLVAVAHGGFGADAPAGPSQAAYDEHRHDWVTIGLAPG
ncbi:GFA family protein [Phreatobacter stygius]|uniref:GFA family protein n=1 Tax=Phreatobacter stygius TaxID=1940610 RepID=A0A4D7BNQ5_9HYPH|nr:GFA family protein [Phreatobacter stygius]QCI69567.1 GFA family protein [Phreatobacter stygius]